MHTRIARRSLMLVAALAVLLASAPSLAAEADGARKGATSGLVELDEHKVASKKTKPSPRAAKKAKGHAAKARAPKAKAPKRAKASKSAAAPTKKRH